MKNKLLLILLVIPVLIACGESATSQVTSSSVNPTISNTTSIVPTTSIEPLTELYNRINASVTGKNYSLRYNLNGVDVQRLYLPNAFYDVSSSIGYAEDSEGIFSYSLFKTNVIAGDDYLKDSENNPLKGLYDVKVTTTTSERVYTDYLINSLMHINYSKISSLKFDENTGLYRISFSYVKGILPNDPDTDMYNTAGIVTTKIGLTDEGFAIHYYNQYAMDTPLILECYDIGKTKIDPIKTYLNENKGPGDSGKLEDYSKLAKIRKLFSNGNYKVTTSDGETRYITDKYVVKERIIDDELLIYGYVLVPDGNTLGLENGPYAYEVNNGVVTLTETESTLYSISQATGHISNSIFASFVENDDGTIVCPSGLSLYSYGDSFSSRLSEEGSYVKECSITLDYEQDLPIVNFNCKVFNENTDASYDLTVTVSDFNTTEYTVLENYLSSIM